MEHIVQFAISIDDDAIVKKVSENAEKKIIEDLKQQVANKIFEAYYYNRNADPKHDKLSSFSENIVLSFLEANKDELLDKAAALLADRLARSKKGKEILKRLYREKKGGRMRVRINWEDLSDLYL
jgi:ferritin-like protein